jgi:CubicO group peptidase (beta-lactamase class C family)
MDRDSRPIASGSDRLGDCTACPRGAFVHPVQELFVSSNTNSDPVVSRRQVLVKGASLITGALAIPAASGQEVPATGSTARRLAAYDDLMQEFFREYRPPGAALAVARNGRLVYARGFGFADVEKREAVQPHSLFRIASVSKPITAAACFRLIEQGKLHLGDKVFELLGYRPDPGSGSIPDARLMQVTVRDCLQHTGGWDRGKSGDPMGNRSIRALARSLNIRAPVKPEQIIQYMMGKPLDFDPGTAFVYSNFGYCVLGRVIEKVSGKSYGEFVRKEVLEPLGIQRMRLARNLLRDRAPGEARYYDAKKRTAPAISGPNLGQPVPLPYGGEAIEAMDANGGWIASAIDLVRFATALEYPEHSKLLKPDSIRTMMARPDGAPGRKRNGDLKETYYGCGWNVRPVDPEHNRFTRWHDGLLAGTSALLVSRQDRICWAILFNSDSDAQGKRLASTIDPLLHRPANQIKEWPEFDLFREKVREG